ncbi:TonB-dependent receptor [Flagellatimonas centrodinii]|uniref:TonB-dependent receptor domain-containing protein n=1 Tax=Flagellatimonas centrodinii TaxID=2806210 RepID=UPI001FEE7BC9|nr:TonB-dependent receptor [Flagellatimonas centrodinii]ULQ47841.1 TonB-dependent receptor [Flagellatimonas centrodinii]
MINQHWGTMLRACRKAPFRIALLCAALLPAMASAQGTQRFDIPSQPAASAIKTLALQADFEILVPEEAAQGFESNALNGEYEATEALFQMLKGTGLTYKSVAPNAFVVEQGELTERPFVIATDNTTAPSASTEAASDPNANGELFDPRVDTTAEPGGTSQVDIARRAGVEEIIVTGQKKSERLQDVPIAISAFSMEDLTKSQIAGGPDLITQVPNMTFTKTNFSGYSIQIRGIGTQAISATTDPAVAVAMNNTPFVRNRFFEQEFYDLERIEVLRGPQGTLYGRNATAGVVNLITAKPSFYAEARASVDMGNYNSHRIEQMINLPLVEDTVALRFAGAWTKRDGYADNAITDSPIDGRDLWSTRTSLRFKPNDIIEANLIWEHFEEDDDRLRSGKQLCDKDVVTNVAGFDVDYFDRLSGAGQPTSLFSGVQATLSQGCKRGSLYANESFQTPNGLMLPYYAPLAGISLPVALDDPYLSTSQQLDLRTIESTINPEYRAKADVGELQINVALTDALTLSSETSYSDDFVYSLQDFNRFNTAPGAWQNPSTPGVNFREGVLLEGENGGIFCDPQLGCSDRLVAVDISTAESRQFSQELRIASDFDGPFNFSLGANYLRYTTEDKYYVFFNSISLIAALGSGTSGPTRLPYVAGVSDNGVCLPNGYAPGDPAEVYGVIQCVYIDPNPIGSLNDKGHNYFLSRNPYTLHSQAIFGEAYYNITPDLKLTVGARWSEDEKDAPRIPSWTLASLTVGYPTAEVISQTWREPTGRIVLDWKPDLGFTDETLVYGSFSRGYKAGGANPPGFVYTYYGDPIQAQGLGAVSATRPRTFEPEFINAYEIGTKNTLLDGRLTVNMAAFYYNYHDYQISEIVDRSAFNRNFDAEIWGFELETDWYALDNLRLGFKGGYQKTRIGDGEKAIDLMDRTAGNEDWVVVRPFPTYASSCILPEWLFDGLKYPATDGVPGPAGLGGVGGGRAGGCEIAYLNGNDPVTNLPYVADPTEQDSGAGTLQFHPNYPGWDPATAPNNGEGFEKDLSGNELPNAPNYTLTLTGDYILPLGNAWLMTLHADLHWQSESWWRIFNDHEFSRLDDYYTANVAAIFMNEASGWNVMAYVKNVFDETAISGAFLNSDDTGLTTNIFLTEPRLFGLRVTKNWGGGSTLGNFGRRFDAGHRWPLQLEVGGQVQRVDADNTAALPTFYDAFSGPLDIAEGVQSADLGWGQTREIKLGWRPDAGPWTLSVGYRQGNLRHSVAGGASWETEPFCPLVGGSFEAQCTNPIPAPIWIDLQSYSRTNRVAAEMRASESYRLFDVAIRRDLELSTFSRSSVELAVRRARLISQTQAALEGVPDWMIPENVDVFFVGQRPVTHTVYQADFDARRGFDGTGPLLTWSAASPLFGNPQSGVVELDWSLSGGALFGRQTTDIADSEESEWYYAWTATQASGFQQPPQTPTTITERTVPGTRRSTSETVPMVGATLGLSYRVNSLSLSAGYRWERYIDAIDGGVEERKTYDRTIEGPTLKLGIGFGG